MTPSFRISVADDEPDMRDYFERMLPRMGHQVVSVAENGRQLVEHCLALRPDLVITDINMPELDGIAAAEVIFKQCPIPVILVSGYHDRELIERAEADHIQAYLTKPIKKADLEPSIALAVARFAQFQALRKEADDLRHALEDRKVIERAKGILMRQAGLDEPDAFARLQKTASEHNLKLIEAARSILLADHAFQPPKP
jgi:two-component system, response regulator PdtaR